MVEALIESKISKKPLEPQRTLRLSLYIIKQCSLPLLGDYFNPKWIWKWNWRLYHMLVCILSTAICYAFSGWKSRHNLSEFVFFACLIMADVMFLQRNISWVNSQPKMSDIRKRLLEFTNRREQVPEAYTVLLSYYRFLHRIVISFTVMIAGIGITLALSPIVYYLITGEMLLVIQCFIPYVDYKAHPGFEIHVVIHGWCSIFAVAGITATALFVLLMLAQICVGIDVLRVRLQNLTCTIRDEESDEREIIELMKEIFEEHQGLVEYIDSCEAILSFQNLSDHCVVGVQACLGLFICLQQFWLPGYALIVLGFLVTFSID